MAERYELRADPCYGQFEIVARFEEDILGERFKFVEFYRVLGNGAPDEEHPVWCLSEEGFSRYLKPLDKT